MKPTRRDFLKTSALGVTVSFLAPSLFSRSLIGDAVSGDKILVIVQLSGGNDCVNTFIPYTDPKYRSLRPKLGIPDAQIIKVDSQYGFHPGLAKLQPLWDAGKFAFINNVGFTSLDRSHFRCRDVWQTGDDSYGQTQRGILGWLGRYADLYLNSGASALTSLSIGSTIPLGMRADDVLSAVVTDAASYDVQTDNKYPNDRTAFIDSLRSIYGLSEGDPSLEVIRDNGGDMFKTIDLLKTIPPPSTTVTYPNSALGRGLKLVAQTIAGNVGTQAVWLDTGGFDTHSNQLNTHNNLLTDVGDSLAAFQQDLNERGLSDRVMVMAWTEFGRRVQENASDGTDHGKAGTVMLLGNAVKGKTYYGDGMNLNDLDAGDLKTHVDFRSVYSTIIQDFFGKDPYPVLNGTYSNVGFINKESVPTHRRRPVRPS